MAKGKYHEWLTEDGLLLLRKWARNGLTDAEIAEHMGINVATLYRWKGKHSDICNALKKTKDMYDSEVEEALEKSALGYYVEEEEWRYDPDRDDFVLTKRYKKWIKPDTTAQIFWLKNRDKTHWRDRQEVQMDLDDEAVAPIAIIPKREILEPPKGDNDDEN